MNSERLIVVSNRLPFTVGIVNGEPCVQPSGGGLVTAILPILKRTGGSWIGWAGSAAEENFHNLQSSYDPYTLHPIFLDAAEQAAYYDGFSNEIIWPLFHGLPSRCRFRASYWKTYCRVNDKFAHTVEAASQPNDLIWVHDYHLMLQASALRRRGMDHRLVYFHHIPFPAPDIFEALPWRENVLHALLQFDLIGFQTTRDQNNFLACLNRCLARVRINTIGNDAVVSTKRRWTKIATYPISVDYESLSAHSCDQAVIGEVEAIRSKMGQTRIILGVDRLDYTKGIPERLFAFRTLLEHNPQLRGKVTMLQFVVPSREQIPEYRDLKIRLERLVSQINGEYATPGWSPIQYFYRSISTAELMAYYRAADIALITPLKDGMNLVAKEFCSARVDSRGVLILSEFAGAAEELKCGALTVNPHDTERMAAVLRKALQMSESEQRMRMETMRSHIRAHDVFHWAQSFDICNFNENAAPNTVQVACS